MFVSKIIKPRKQPLFAAKKRVQSWWLMATLSGTVFGGALLAQSAQAQDAPMPSCQINSEAQRVYGANPIVTYMLVAMAPQKLMGWNFPVSPQAKGIFPDALFAKPIIGGWFGQGRTPNMEVLLAGRPQLIVMSDAMVDSKRQQLLQQMDVPVCYLTLNRLDDFPDSFRRLGEWLHNPQRGEQLAQAMEQLLAQQSRLKALLQERNIALKSVYYAQDPNGLASECRGSIHAEVIPWAGAVNPHLCPAEQSRFGKVAINIEQLLKYDPDAIVTQERAFYDKVYQMPNWQGLKAVQNKQVFFAPQTPFRWLDRPPSFMRILAAQWLMQKLYPHVAQIAALDTVQTTQDFFKLFFQVELSREQAQTLLEGGQLS
ncbi:iron ABC transporter substrate-binding protein [Thiosulfatimonas sediminis]|uniref:Iron ABC transporter substrate-binding protein n=1 Tax=Thiosulfatimonas sediminis TaxID=2675054 RepID=A0A6F8PU91_9GAMM|nr:ABC transporter substrate-binding protein [Thiosulfatimonas sediminis]BBP45597.1 iron ABC transporter substrate-binding protein [Thiosulfatimonas sediminis]